MLYTADTVGASSSGILSDGFNISTGFTADNAGTINSRSVSASASDNVAISSTRSIENTTKALCVITGGGAILYECDLTSMDADGFTLSWTSNNAVADEIFYIALAGTDITNCKVGQFNAATATGNQDITDPGFQPDIVFLATAHTTTTNAAVSHAQHTLGIAKSSSEQFAVTLSSENGSGTSECGTSQRTDRIIVGLNPASPDGTLLDEASYSTSLASGFRLNWTNAAASAYPIFYLAIKGVQSSIGSFNQATSTGNQVVTTTLGYQPVGVLFVSHCKVASTSASLHARLSLGAASASTGTPSTADRQTVVYAHDSNGASTMITAKGHVSDNTRVIRAITAATAATSSTINAAASLQSFNSNGLTVNWATVDATARQILYVTFGSTVSTSTVTSPELRIKWDIRQQITSPALTIRYHMGGRVSPDWFSTHRYNILGTVESPPLTLRWDIKNVVTSPELRLKYNIAIPTTIVTSPELRLKWHIIQQLSTIDAPSLTLRWNIEEADVHKTGWGKPLRARVLIYKHNDWQNILLSYNSFRPEESTQGIKIEEIEVMLSSDSAGSFSIQIEDHDQVLDPTVIGKGNAVLISAAKLEQQLTDGEHYLIFGFVRSHTTIREDTGTLQYVLSGYGAAVVFNERVSNFSYSAKRVSVTNPEPDWNDSTMFAYNLVRKLVQDTDHLPLGYPRLPFSVKGVVDRTPLVDDFIPSINERMVEMNEIMDRIADSVSAQWGVRPFKENPSSTTFFVDTFLHYPSLEHSGIVIKDTVKETEGTGTTGGESGEEQEFNALISSAESESTGTDDLSTTSVFAGPWRYTDTWSKEDGFTNRFFARAGVKNSEGNVLNITNLTNEYTELFSNTTPVPIESGPENPLATNPATDFTRFPHLATAGILLPPELVIEVGTGTPTAPIAEHEELANFQRQYPTVKLIVQISLTTTPAWTAQHPAAINAITYMKEAGVTVLGDVPANLASRTQAAIQADIDRYFDWYAVDGVLLNAMNNDGNSTTHLNTYQNIVNYAKNVKGAKMVTAFPTLRPCAEIWYTNTTIDIIVIRNVGGVQGNLRSPAEYAADAGQEFMQNTPMKRRAFWSRDIDTDTGWTETLIRNWMAGMTENNVCSYFYLNNFENGDVAAGSHGNNYLSKWMSVMMSELESLQREAGQSTGGVEQRPIPNPRDLCQSFKPTSQRLTDLMIILSKVGQPLYKAGSSLEHGKIIPDVPNAVHGHIEGSQILSITETDPNTGQQVTRVTEMPSGEIVGYFTIPFADIGTAPTPIFLNNVVTTKSAIIPERRYFVVLHGRGQSESNTIRWHHADASQEDSLSGERIPGGHKSIQTWTIFNQQQAPGFALRFFDTSLQFIEASDSDSIEAFGLVESPLDLSFIPDENLAARYLHAYLERTSKPKRIYDIRRVTAPDKILRPDQIVSIVDRMSSHSILGSDVIDAEVTQVRYRFSAYDNSPLGCRFIEISPVGYVNFQYDLWKKRLERGEITIPRGEDIVVTPPPPPPPTPPPSPPPPPPPNTPPSPPPPPPPSPPPTPPPPPATPPDLDTSGILRTRGPFSSTSDFLSACNNAIAGDMIILANGSYSISSSADTEFSRTGNATNPIIIRAETAGGVTINGTCTFVFTNCQYVTWYGFIHRHDAPGTGNSSGISFSGGHHNRFSRCDVDLNETATRVHFLNLSDTLNMRVDHCDFHHHDAEGGFINTAYDSDVAASGASVVEYCMFRNHTSPASDSGEAVINGSSGICRNDFRYTYRYNMFQNNTGDPECITNKSCRNLYYNNTFLSNGGNLVLRHGDFNAVVGNYFEGQNGIRILGEGNLIANNHITLHPTGATSGRRPMVLENGDTDRPTAQGAFYERVVDNTIIYNTIENGTANVQELVLWGREARTHKPTGVIFRGNILKCANGIVFTFDNSATASGNTISNNIAHATGSASYGDITTGQATRTDPGLTRGTDGVYRITNTSSAAYGFVSTSTNTFSANTTIDIDGEVRQNRADCGCDHYSTASTKPKKRIVASDVGPAATTFLGDSPVWNP